VGRAQATGESTDAVVVEVVRQRTERERVGPGGAAAIVSRPDRQQGVDEAGAQRVEVLGQHAGGLRRPEAGRARDQPGVGLGSWFCGVPFQSPKIGWKSSYDGPK